MNEPYRMACIAHSSCVLRLQCVRAQVLMLCSDPQNHPVLFHCSSGKDRTGLIAALIQSVCGVSEEEILDSYADSETYLAPVLELIAEEDRKRGLSEEFDGTPRYTPALHRTSD